MILKYIYKLLKLWFLIIPHQELLDRLKITYMVEKITKPKHQNPEFLIFNNVKIYIVSKIIIFIDNIEKKFNIVVYFCLKLLLKL